MTGTEADMLSHCDVKHSENVAGVFLQSTEIWKAGCGFCAVLCAICARLWLHVWLLSIGIACRSFYFISSCFLFISATLQTMNVVSV